jgi:hypothetical protein
MAVWVLTDGTRHTTGARCGCGGTVLPSDGDHADISARRPGRAREPAGVQQFAAVPDVSWAVSTELKEGQRGFSRHLLTKALQQDFRVAEQQLDFRHLHLPGIESELNRRSQDFWDAGSLPRQLTASGR